MKIICEATMDAGVLNYKIRPYVTPVNESETMWPKYANGRKVNESFLILKGEKYEVNAKVADKLKFFKEVKRHGKNKSRDDSSI